MPRVTISLALLGLVAALAALATLPAAEAAGSAFSITLPSPKVSLTKDTVELELVVSPPQKQIGEVTIETIVDTAGKTVASDVKVKGNGAKFIAKLSANDNLSAGLYKMKVTAVAAASEDSKETVSEVVPFKVTVPVEIASAKLNDLEIKQGEKIQKQLFSSGSGDALKVTVALQNKLNQLPVTAHQAFLRFTHKAEKTDTYFVLTPDSPSTHSITLNFAVLSKKFSYKSGEHSAQLIFGDASFDKAIVWDIGSVDLQLAAAPPVAPSPLYAKPLLHESDTTLKALPEIKHIMRPQDLRPPIVVSLAFTAAVLLPLAAFLLFAVLLKVNISKLFGGAVFIFGSGFLASLAAIFGLFAWYWIELTMFQTLGYLTVVGTVNVAFGHLTLKWLANSGDVKKTKQE